MGPLDPGYPCLLHLKIDDTEVVSVDVGPGADHGLVTLSRAPGTPVMLSTACRPAGAEGAASVLCWSEPVAAVMPTRPRCPDLVRCSARALHVPLECFARSGLQ